jgi:hypothetical protein
MEKNSIDPLCKFYFFINASATWSVYCAFEASKYQIALTHIFILFTFKNI